MCLPASSRFRADERTRFLRFLLSLVLVLSLGGSARAGEADEIKALNQQITELYRAQKFQEAIPLARKVLELREKSVGAEHADTASALNNLALLLAGAGQVEAAEPLYQRALRIREKVLGASHPDTASTLMGLGVLYDGQGDRVRAAEAYRRALPIFEKSLGADQAEVIDLVERLGNLDTRLGRYTDALPLLERVARFREKTAGADSPDTASALDALAGVLQGLGRYDEAEARYRKALAIRQKALGAEHEETAGSLNNLAGLLAALGEYSKAEPLVQQALRIAQKQASGETAFSAWCANNLGLLYYRMGDLGRAEPLYQKALSLSEKLSGPDHLDTATAAGNLGVLYQRLGDTTRAEPLLERALRIDEKALGASHPDTATALSNLASLYFDMGRYAASQRLFERALTIRKRSLGSGHPDTLQSQENLGAVLMSLRLYEKAADAYEHILKSRESRLGQRHPDVAIALNNLGMARQQAGRLDEAARLYERALAIQSRPGLETSGRVTTLTNLSVLEIERGHRQRATTLARQARTLEEAWFARILSFTSERQRLAYESTVNPCALLGTLGDAASLAEVVLRRKGIVLDSIIEDRRLAEASDDPSLARVLTQLRDTRERLTKLMLEPPVSITPEVVKAHLQQRLYLQGRVEELESSLARRVSRLGASRKSLATTVAAVQGAIPRGSALVEYVRYPRYESRGRWVASYGAIVLAPGKAPGWASLGDAEAMEAAVKRYQRAVRRSGGTPQRRNDEVQKSLVELYRRAWAPVQALLPKDTRACILSPDGELNFVSFATLLTPEDAFLADRYSLRYVSSGRDLLSATPASGSKAMVLFGNPDFNAPLSGGPSPDKLQLAMASISGSMEARGMDLRDLQAVSFAPLPGTARECADLASLARDSGWVAESYLGPEATKTRLKEIHAPRVLHLATHGFFLPEHSALDLSAGTWNTTRGAGGLEAMAALPNPMLRSGMALAGAQSTIQALRQGLAPPLASCGILTAEEVALLPLRGTWLVALSACETGFGEARAGEGVIGLRRGFVQAGTLNLLMTLWPVADTETAQFMRDFYKATSKLSAPDALAQTQREWLERVRKEQGLADAVRLGGPFIMSTQGP